MAAEPVAHSDSDILAQAGWECCQTPAGAVDEPAALDGLPVTWWAATAPGTAASAARAAGVPDPSVLDLDGDDWWFRCRFRRPAAPGPWVLCIGGLATLADVWLNGLHVLASRNMFRRYELDVRELALENTLAIRFAALQPVLAARQPRPRWKTPLAHANLRWLRTSLLGRTRGIAVTPPIVGPWRPIELIRAGPVRVVRRRLSASCDAGDGLVEVSLELMAPEPLPDQVLIEVGEASLPLPVRRGPDGCTVSGVVRIVDAERWWPHTHGPQPLYRVRVTVAGHRIDLGQVGFRTVHVDRGDGGFGLLVNETPVFCRGAGWFPPDALAPTTDDDELRRTLSLVRSAGLNMLRLPGSSVYEDERFWNLCDELGILVWQDCMLAYLDPPDDEDFAKEIEAELGDNIFPLAAHPALAVVCGGQEIEEIAAMSALPRERWTFPVLTETIPSIVRSGLGEIPYLSSCPSGGDFPFDAGVGVAFYFGVGGFLRPLDDVRRAHVRFAAECLCLATPPDQRTVDEHCGGANAAGHDPQWKRAVHHDAGRSWDMDDVRDFYVRELLGVDPLMERYVDAQRALDLGRAANAEMVEAVFSEWRRPGSGCAGGLLAALRDLRPGAGWGMLDSFGRPKSTWYAFRRVSLPVALLLTDERFNGLNLHVVNDTTEPISGTIRVALFARGEHRVDEASHTIKVDARSGMVIEAGSLFDGFRDISYAYRFAPPAQDVVVASLHNEAEDLLSEVVYLPLGRGRPLEGDLGLEATARRSAAGAWILDVTSRRFAQFVVVDVEGFIADNSWFHLPPGATRTVNLMPLASTVQPRGYVSALNTTAVATISVEDDR
jgi:beta-mannosidase